MDGSVTIINYNENAESIVSAAGRISTTEGSANDIYNKSCEKEREKNIKLINKILLSGHESVLEHIFFNLSFDNVSVFVEQFMIEFRLASFTVKSRRYVDFGKMGYFIPDFEKHKEDKSLALKTIYCEHIDYLFGEYNFLVQQGIPKEDARFVLPYSFKSNFYCTVNARELLKIMNELVYGRGSEYPELVMLGQSLFRQCEEKLPYLNIEKKQHNIKKLIKQQIETALPLWAVEKSKKEELVTFLNGSSEPEKVICTASALNAGVVNWDAVQIEDKERQRNIIKMLLRGGRKRELEQVNFTFLFHRISLAGVTHLVRHRMQSIVIPEYREICDFNEYVLPGSIVAAGLEERYKEIFVKGKQVLQMLVEKGMDSNDRVYLLLSGLTIPVMTTMNANELNVFFNLRTCNRAQWEIKECADYLLKILREKYPVLFSMFGPSCYVTGVCPEGKMTCGIKEDVCRRYSLTEEESV